MAKVKYKHVGVFSKDVKVIIFATKEYSILFIFQNISKYIVLFSYKN